MALNEPSSLRALGLGAADTVFPEETQSASVRQDWMRQLAVVRKQEFAHLRNIQKREGGVNAEPTLAGVPVRLPKILGVRGDTVKKIDEIEAQIELLWSLSRQIPTDSRFGPNTVLPGSTEAAPQSLIPDSALLVATLNFAATEQATPPASSEKAPAKPTTAISESSESGEKVLSKAATLFANADYASAAELLLHALKPARKRSPESLRQAMALLDIYRATHAQAQFDACVLQYFGYWNGSTPQWHVPSTAQGQDAKSSNAALDKAAQGTDGPRSDASVWRCPTELNLPAAQQLIAYWQAQPHCEVDWQCLVAIAPDAAARLANHLNAPQNLASKPMFWGTARLLDVLAQSTPQGDSQVQRSLWDLRFCLLELTHQQTAFDAAATDFCMTYLRQAPTWRPTATQIQCDLPAPSSAGESLSCDGWQLQGHIFGAQALELPALPSPPHSGPIRINCASLLRMDAEASARLLDWLQDATAKKADIQLHNVSVLVGAAWEAAGVGAFARLHLQELT